MAGTLPLPSSSSEVEEKRSERRRPPPPRAAPWLVIPHGKGKKDQAFYNLCEPENRTCRRFIPEMSRKSFWQKPCHQGWLVMLCDDDEAKYPILPNCNYGDCFLWNPLTLQTIQLPTLLHWLNKSDQYWICDCVLSSPPGNKNNPHEDDSMVFFLMESFDTESQEHVLVYCRPGEDKKWRTKVLPRTLLEEDVQSLLCFRRKFYVMCVNSKHLEIEIQRGHDDDGDDETFSIKSFEINYDANLPVVGVPHSWVEYYYVESCNELFFIDVTPYKPKVHRNLLASIQVFRLDFSLMAWEKVKSLGDHVLFVGKNTTASCSAAELGLLRGCLYYTMLEDQSLYKFEVEDAVLTPILPCLKLPTPWFSAGWIMMPTNVRVVDGRRRRIEDMSGKNKEEDNFVKLEKNKASIILIDDKEIQGQKQNGGELEEARTWCSLNKDMVELIASYLHPVDYGCFRAACKANQMMIPALYRRSSFAGIITTIYLSPWLVFSTDNDTIYNFVDPMHNNEKYLMNLPELLIGAIIRFSKGGWLLMSKGTDTLFFYNPFTRAIIQLPEVRQNVLFTCISFSSLPTSSDCVVFGIRNWDDLGIFVYVIARGDDSWMLHSFENINIQKYTPCINNPVFYDGAFYCLDYNGTLGAFDLKNGSTWKVLANPQGHFSNDYPSFLMECDGKLLAVDLGHLGKSVGIFRLDFSKMAWVKVESLGKHMLFISKTSCFSAIAPHDRMQNKIYFPRLQGEGILFYSLDTGKFHSIGSQHVANGFYDTKEWFNCTWIEPNWSRTTEQELDWLSI